MQFGEMAGAGVSYRLKRKIGICRECNSMKSLWFCVPKSTINIPPCSRHLILTGAYILQPKIPAHRLAPLAKNNTARAPFQKDQIFNNWRCSNVCSHFPCSASLSLIAINLFIPGIIISNVMGPTAKIPRRDMRTGSLKPWNREERHRRRCRIFV